MMKHKRIIVGGIAVMILIFNAGAFAEECGTKGNHSIAQKGGKVYACMSSGGEHVWCGITDSCGGMSFSCAKEGPVSGGGCLDDKFKYS